MRRADPDHQRRRRAKILDNARRLFARDGYDRVSMDRLAAACHLTKPALYYYFRNKRAVLLATLQAHWAAQSAVLAAFRPSPDLGATLRAFAELVLRESRRPENGDIIRIVMAETGRRPEIGPAFFEVFAPPLETKLVGFVAPHLGRRYTRDTMLALLHQFVGSLAHYSLMRQVFRAGRPYLPEQRAYVDVLIDGFLAVTSTPARSRR
jgi:TetR/AcrR family transcriptional regulator, mexJK operon transcriptional repressor